MRKFQCVQHPVVPLYSSHNSLLDALLAFTDFPQLCRGSALIFDGFFILFQVNKFIRSQIDHSICGPEFGPQAFKRRFRLLRDPPAVLETLRHSKPVLSGLVKSFV
jgi:hypothetical protein